jgi:hypothetical protein
MILKCVERCVEESKRQVSKSLTIHALQSLCGEFDRWYKYVKENKEDKKTTC